jgi:YD repeat-containing protein
MPNYRRIDGAHAYYFTMVIRIHRREGQSNPARGVEGRSGSSPIHDGGNLPAAGSPSRDWPWSSFHRYVVRTAYAYRLQSGQCAGPTLNKPHAVMSTGSAIFCYDANGNMTQKIDGSSTSYTYDAENRMVSVSGAASATFVYDGDGNRVKGVVGGVTTTYIGNYFEPLQGRWLPSGKTTLRVQAGSTSTMMKYYYAGTLSGAGGTRVAERVSYATIRQAGND